MIDELHVKNLALIRDAALILSTGMTVLTGETGAGKTALLSACRLMMGQRADKSMVRDGEDEAFCDIRLFVSADSDLEDSQIVASRKISADGRSRCKIDGTMASVAELAASISPYIDLCSQHDQQLLMSSATQRALLDTWIGAKQSGLLNAYRDALSFARDKKRLLDEITQSAQSSDQRLNDAKRTLMRITSLNPSDEDYEQIKASLKKAENAELLARTSSEAEASLNGENAALDNLNAAIVLLEEGAHGDESLSDLSNTLREAIYIVEDVARDVASYASAIELDVGELEFMQERMAAYQSILREFGPTLDDVYKVQKEASMIVDAAMNSDKSIEEAKHELEQAESNLSQAAIDLSSSRNSGAPSLVESANKVLDRLNMQGARIDIEVKRLSREAWTEDGPDDVRMMFVPAAGMQPRQLSRIASGGELSRVMLAIRVAMGERDEMETLVFDEIDAGVGGESALALADVLSELSQSHQVIVVTHLPQIAAKADVQYLVEKLSDSGSTYTNLKELDQEERVTEIARMLSGSITESSLAHARELLLL